MTPVPKPHKPIGWPAIVFLTMLNPLFGLIALVARSQAIRHNTTPITEEATTMSRRLLKSILHCVRFAIVVAVVLLLMIGLGETFMTGG